MSTIQILIHALPREIDGLERVCDQLHRSSFFLENSDKVNLDITLNLSDEFTDWENSSLPKEFFIDKFKAIEIRSDWTNKNYFEISHGDVCSGCNDKRRNSIRQYSDQVSHFLYADPDIAFPIWGLYYMFRAIESINTNYHIISGEVLKLWDNSWDSIVNERFINIPIDLEDFPNRKVRFYKEFDPYRLDSEFFNNIDSTDIKIIPNFKFAGGLFTCFSSNLLKFIDIPDELGPYGLDDTYVLQCSHLMKQMGYDIQQYTIKNLVVCESRRYKHFPAGFQDKNVEPNPYIKFLAQKINENDRDILAENAKKAYPSLINKFIQRANKK